MNRDPGQNNYCGYVYSEHDSKDKDKEEKLCTWLDRCIVCVGFSFLALCAMCVLMVVYYFFG